MSLIAEGFQFGNIIINKDFIKTKSEIETLGDAEGYPDVFPIWCKDDNNIYIYYKLAEDGSPKVVNLTDLLKSSNKAVFYPIIDSKTNELSWEIRELTSEVPEPVILTGKAGKSAYEVWKDLGNDGTEQDFLNSLVPDLTNLNQMQITVLKTQLGIDQLEHSIQVLNDSLDNVVS